MIIHKNKIYRSTLLSTIFLSSLLGFFVFYPTTNTTQAASSRYRRPTPTPTFTPTPTPIPGFTGQYFNNLNMSGTPTVTRIDNQINFDWAGASPSAGITADYFSARWTKTQNFSAGIYKFTITADDGVRFYIDNRLVLDKWIDQPATTYEINQSLTSGNHILKMEYYENAYNAVAKLSWTVVTPATPTPTNTPTPSPSPFLTPTPTTQPTPTSTPLPTPTSLPTITPTPTIIPTTQTLKWGASAGWGTTDLTDLETLAGKPVNYRSLFLAWPDQFPTYLATPLKPANKTLVLFWESYDYSYNDILTGKADAYFTSFASSLKTYGGPVILVPFEEVNDGSYPWSGGVNGNTPAQFIQTFQYVRKFFTNIPNVQFAWNVNVTSPFNPPINQPASYYPGDANVDIIGVDGMNFGNPWQSFTTIYDYTLNVLKQYNKPVLIMSVASAPGPEKGNWIRQGLGIDIKKYPFVTGWIWFNEDKETDWRINSDLDSLSAFQSVLP